MSTSSNNMTHINYKATKDRMLESAKGFWKVKSVHKLTNRLKIRYNPKDFIILKTIKKPDPKLPSFISFEHKINRNITPMENHKNNSCLNLKVGNFFITGNNKLMNKQKKKEEIKIIYNKLFGCFNYEPFLYNDCQFFYLQKEKRLLPRKFKDVIKDCLALREYKNHINNFEKGKDLNISTENDINNINTNINNIKNNINTHNNNTNKNLSYAGKEPTNYLNIFERIYSNKENNNIGSVIRHKIIKRKCLSSHDIRSTKDRREIISRPSKEKNKEFKKFPTLHIKSVYKLKDN